MFLFLSSPVDFVYSVKELLFTTELCLTLCNPMDSNPTGSSVHGISQARRLECVAISFSKGSSRPRDCTHVSCIGKQVLYHLGQEGSPIWVYPKSNERVLKRKKQREISNTEGKCMWRQRQKWSYTASSQGIPGATEARGSKNKFFPRVFSKSLALQHLILDFWSLEWWANRFFDILSHQVCDNLLQQV